MTRFRFSRLVCGYLLCDSNSISLVERFISSCHIGSGADDHSVEVVEGTVRELIEDNDVTIGVKYKKGEGQIHMAVEIAISLTVHRDQGSLWAFNDSLRWLFFCFSEELPGDPSCGEFHTILPSTIFPYLWLQTKSHFVGVIMDTTDLPFPNKGHVVLADPAPILMYPISSTEVRVLVDFPTIPPNLPETLLTKTLPQVPPTLQVYRHLALFFSSTSSHHSVFICYVFPHEHVGPLQEGCPKRKNPFDA